MKVTVYYEYSDKRGNRKTLKKEGKSVNEAAYFCLCQIINNHGTNAIMITHRTQCSDLHVKEENTRIDR